MLFLGKSLVVIDKINAAASAAVNVKKSFVFTVKKFAFASGKKFLPKFPLFWFSQLGEWNLI